MTTRHAVIAIIDDDPFFGELLQTLTSSLGYQTELYGSADEFIQAAKQSQAACLLVDIQLGDITGVELVRHLASTGVQRPTIFMTGSHDRTFRDQAMEFGCVAYLLKPFAATLLNAAIEKALSAATQA